MKPLQGYDVAAEMLRRSELMAETPREPRIEFIDLSPVRHRLAPPPKLSAMEEARRMDQAEQWREWRDAVLMTLAIVMAVMVLSRTAMFFLR